jgi:hypothetical protein
VRPLVFALAIGCSPAAPPPVENAPPPEQAAGPPACEPELIDQIFSEAIDVAIAGDTLFWHEYNFGTIRKRPIAGGAVETIVEHDAEHHSEGFAATAEHLSWTSKQTGQLYRVDHDGRGREALLAADAPMTLAIAGEVIYATTLTDGLVWWRGGATGKVAVPPSTRIAAAGDALYIANAAGLVRLDRPAGRPERLSDSPDRMPVKALAAAADALWWVSESPERSVLWRLSLGGGEPARVSGLPSGYAQIAPTENGALISVGNVLYESRGDGIDAVAVAPADITSIAASGDAIFAGTGEGSLHRLCRGAPELVDRMPAIECAPGETVKRFERRHVCADAAGRWTGAQAETYVSGDLRRSVAVEGGVKTEKELYADGTALRVTTSSPAVTRHYWVNGQLASEIADGVATKRFNLDGTPR